MEPVLQAAADAADPPRAGSLWSPSESPLESPMTSPPQLGYTAPMPVLMMHSGGAATQQPIAKLAAGVANALLRLIENWSVLATVAPPPVLDERVDPLLAHPDAGLVAFLWGEGAALGLRMPHSSVLSAFITTMALRIPPVARIITRYNPTYHGNTLSHLRAYAGPPTPAAVAATLVTASAGG